MLVHGTAKDLCNGHEKLVSLWDIVFLFSMSDVRAQWSRRWFHSKQIANTRQMITVLLRVSTLFEVKSSCSKVCFKILVELLSTLSIFKFFWMSKHKALLLHTFFLLCSDDIMQATSYLCQSKEVEGVHRELRSVHPTLQRGCHGNPSLW